jgi:hypothetical protein
LGVLTVWPSQAGTTAIFPDLRALAAEVFDLKLR